MASPQASIALRDTRQSKTSGFQSWIENFSRSSSGELHNCMRLRSFLWNEAEVHYEHYTTWVGLYARYNVHNLALWFMQAADDRKPQFSWIVCTDNRSINVKSAREALPSLSLKENRGRYNQCRIFSALGRCASTQVMLILQRQNR